VNQEIRDRILLPIGIPLGAAVLILVVVLTVSRVLLAVPQRVAVAVALMLALNILAVAAVVTLRPRLRSIDFAFLAGVAAVPVLAGVFVAAGAVQVREPGEERNRPPPPQQVPITAQDLAFNTKQLAFKAGSPVVIAFTSKDAQPHNVSIYRTTEDAGTQQNALLKGATFTGPGTKRYQVAPPIPAGSYFFQCDVHPTTMNGTVTVEAAPPGPAQPQQPVNVDISATGTAYDKAELSFPAGAPITITFNNKANALTHNVSIYANQADADVLKNPLFKGDLFAGPATRKYRVKPLQPGTYVFHCDVHPAQMRGVVNVA
jgi:plastocyanin